MASTNKTTNYELSQFVETDRPAWLTDYNGDMRTIDSTMKAISDVASGASGSISELADRMSTAEGNITTNTNDISALDARADSLEAQAQSTAGTIANIQTEQTAQNLGIEAATELGYNLARPYDSASTYAVGAYVLFQNTLYKCVTAVSTGEAFDPTKWIAIKATDEIAAGGYTLPIASASTLGGVKVGSNLSIDPATGLLSVGNVTNFVTNAITNVTVSGQTNPLDFNVNMSALIQIGSIYILFVDCGGRNLTIANVSGSLMRILFDWNTTEHSDFVFPQIAGGLKLAISKFSKGHSTSTPVDLDISSSSIAISNNSRFIDCNFNNVNTSSVDYSGNFRIETIAIFSSN